MATRNTDFTNHQSFIKALPCWTSEISIEHIKRSNEIAARRSIETGRAIRIVGEPIPLNQSHFLAKTEAGNEKPLSAEIEVFKEWIRSEFAASYR